MIGQDGKGQGSGYRQAMLRWEEEDGGASEIGVEPWQCSGARGGDGEYERRQREQKQDMWGGVPRAHTGGSENEAGGENLEAVASGRGIYGASALLRRRGASGRGTTSRLLSHVRAPGLCTCTLYCAVHTSVQCTSLYTVFPLQQDKAKETGKITWYDAASVFVTHVIASLPCR